MLKNFQFTHYRLTYTVQEPLKMSPYKGNIFRGQFGYLLRHIACIGDTGQCQQKCQHTDRCVYSKCFETPVPKDSPILRGQPYAPHPFILQPPHTTKKEYTPDDTFNCNITLIGEAINLLPWIVLTFHEMGKRRIGLRGARGQCLLRKVETLHADQNQSPQTIYTADTEMLTDEGIILNLDEIMHNHPEINDTIELEFITPTSIKVDGKWTNNLTFEHLIRNLLRRIRFLSYFHCGQDLEVDASALIDAARALTHEPRFRWFKSNRYSYRAESTIPMDGFIGKVRYSGELEPFLPFIYLGKYLHIGHHTAFGYGQYRTNATSIN